MAPFASVLAAAAIAQFGLNAPSLSAAAAPTPYGVLGCLQRARTALYVNGGSNLQERGNSLFAVIAGDTTAMLWCRGDHVVIVGAGAHHNQAVESLKASF